MRSSPVIGSNISQSLCIMNKELKYYAEHPSNPNKDIPTETKYIPTAVEVMNLINTICEKTANINEISNSLLKPICKQVSTDVCTVPCQSQEFDIGERAPLFCEYLIRLENIKSNLEEIESKLYLIDI